MKKLKTFLFLPLVLTCLNVTAGEPGITFLFTSGGKASFVFSSKPKIAVTSDGLTISSINDAGTSYTFEDVQRFYFDEDITTSIKAINSNQQECPAFSFIDGKLIVRNLNKSGRVTVYSVSGTLKREAMVDNNGNAQISFNDIEEGVYVVSTSNGVSFKIINKK